MKKIILFKVILCVLVLHILVSCGYKSRKDYSSQWLINFNTEEKRYSDYTELDLYEKPSLRLGKYSFNELKPDNFVLLYKVGGNMIFKNGGRYYYSNSKMLEKKKFLINYEIIPEEVNFLPEKILISNNANSINNLTYLQNNKILDLSFHEFKNYKKINDIFSIKEFNFDNPEDITSITYPHSFRCTLNEENIELNIPTFLGVTKDQVYFELDRQGCKDIKILEKGTSYYVDSKNLYYIDQKVNENIFEFPLDFSTLYSKKHVIKGTSIVNIEKLPGCSKDDKFISLLSSSCVLLKREIGHSDKKIIPLESFIFSRYFKVGDNYYYVTRRLRYKDYYFLRKLEISSKIIRAKDEILETEDNVFYGWRESWKHNLVVILYYSSNLIKKILGKPHFQMP